MKIRKLEIVGFKSFVDRTVVNFDHDVTAVVGPNGCGKSNVVDAIKWVMGEQSAQRLRGKGMEDVIFAGCETKGPAGFAEVSLTFDNTDGLTPPEYKDYAEICVARRLDRDGRSDYFINGTSVRLMDVTNLFLGTGVGRRAYSIIEQGRIGYIVSSKPQDRRYMIEEAAGVTKYKARKRAAERKMDHTRQNLMRVGDIVTELEKNLNSLKRQAQKAERYKRYRNEVRDLELHIASSRYLELHQLLRVLNEQVDEAKGKVDTARATLREKETTQELAREEVEALRLQVEEEQKEAFRLENEINVLEGEIERQTLAIKNLQERQVASERELEQLGTEEREQRANVTQKKDDLAELLAGAEDAERVLTRERGELERRQSLLSDARQSMEAQRALAAEIASRIARGEAVLETFEKQREEAEKRSKNNGMHLASLREELSECETRKVDFAHRLEEATQQLATKKEELRLLADKRASLLQEAQQSESELRQARELRVETESRLKGLRAILERLEGVDDGPKTVLQQEDDDGLCIVADVLKPRNPNVARALVAALGERLNWVVTKTDAQAKELARKYAVPSDDGGGCDRVTFLSRQTAHAVTNVELAHANENSAGRTDRDGSEKDSAPKREWSLFPGALRTEAVEFEAFPHRLEERASTRPVAFLDHKDRPKHPLIDELEIKDGFEYLAETLLGKIGLADDLGSALRERNEGCAYATYSGEFVGQSGSITVGRDREKETLLQVQADAERLQDALMQQTAAADEKERGNRQVQEALKAAKEASEAATKSHHALELETVKLSEAAAKLDEQIARSRSGQKRLQDEAEELQALLVSIATEAEAALADLEDARSHADAAKANQESVRAMVSEREKSAQEQTAKVTEYRVEAAQAQERVERDRAAIHVIEERIAAIGEKSMRLVTRRDEEIKEQARLAEVKRELQEKLSSDLEAVDGQKKLAETTREKFDQSRKQLAIDEKALREHREITDSMNDVLNQLAMERRETDLELEHLLDTVKQQHSVDLRAEMTSFHSLPLPTEETTKRVKELHRLIERMGNINLTAIEDFDEKSERYDYLSQQKIDLEESLVTLDKAIRQMNRESKKLFKDAFVGINERFKKIFPQMFRGGKAELKLTDPHDILETGVEIIASPPGKRLGSLELMSGGEKALTAVALIFSIFQYKPSPFCILDEVDAPLDEANIGRFAGAIRQMTDRSQFIVITHSKATMEKADVLYGVTMQTPGISKMVSVEVAGREVSAEASAA